MSSMFAVNNWFHSHIAQGCGIRCLNDDRCVLPASRRKALECKMRSRSRSKQVRIGSGASCRCDDCRHRSTTWRPSARVARSSASRSTRERSARAARRAALVVGARDGMRRRAGPSSWPPIVRAFCCHDHNPTRRPLTSIPMTHGAVVAAGTVTTLRVRLIGETLEARIHHTEWCSSQCGRCR